MLSPTATQSVRVLIVDDMALYRRILSDTMASIESVGPCDTAHHGRAAMEKLRARPADLVLLDVEMPEMGGLETLAAIGREFPTTAVIMVSAVNKHSAATTIEASRKARWTSSPNPKGRAPSRICRS